MLQHMPCDAIIAAVQEKHALYRLRWGRATADGGMAAKSDGELQVPKIRNQTKMIKPGVQPASMQIMFSIYWIHSVHTCI